MKADLKAYCGIGFQRYWRIMQGVIGRNLVKLIVDRAMNKDLDLVAVTSIEERGIEKGSIHDRFGYLVREAIKLPENYSYDKVGENVLVVEKQGNRVYLLNSQGVITLNDGERRDFVAIGSNEIPNHLPLDEALAECDGRGLIKLAISPDKTYSLREELLREREDCFDAMVYDAGQGYRDMCKTREFAVNAGLNLACVSNAHSISEIGCGSIDFSGFGFDVSDEEKLKIFLKELLRGENRFKNLIDPPSRATQLKWKVPLGIYAVVWEKLGKRLCGIKREGKL